MLQKVMQKPLCPPKVKSFMLEQRYWIDEIAGDTDKLVLNDEEIIEFNNKSLKRMKSRGFGDWLCDLETYPGIITGDELLHTMKAHSSEEVFPSKPCYDINANKITKAFKEEVLNQSNFDGVPYEIRVEWGILVKRENVRAFPTKTVFAKDSKTIDFDLFQLATLQVGSLLAILHKSCKGWVKSASVALVKNKKEVFEYVNSKNFLMVTGSKVETEPNPFIKEISNIFFQMGDKIPLIKFDEIPESIPTDNLHAQSPHGCYVVKIPVRDKGGFLSFRLALIARSNDVCEGYLPYTRGNIIRQAFKLLGERYGWNGMFNRRDCSQLVMSVYKTMNIIIPTYTWMQEEGTAGKSIEFSGSIQNRESILDNLQPGDLIYLKGHVVMYLGKLGRNYYVIHSGAGYGIKNKTGKLKPVTVHGVFISEVHQWLMKEEKSYLEAFTSARKFA